MLRYQGGKCFHRKRIAEILEANRAPGQLYIEPFVGGAWVLGKMTGERQASDTNQALITYYQAIQTGWLPPEEVTEEDYREAFNTRDPLDPRTAFILIGCTFGGVWCGGYARRESRNGRVDAKSKAKNCYDNVLKYRGAIADVKFTCIDYRKLKPEGALIYCDPPYANTKGYKGGKFDSEEFWHVVRCWSRDNTVFVSEYTAPEDFKAVAAWPHHLHLRSTNGHEERTEKLFKYRGG